MSKELEIIVVIVDPGKPARVEIIENKLETFQELVGGYVVIVRMGDFIALVNEDGRRLDLEPNFGIYEGRDYIAGTAIFLSTNHNTGEFASLSPVEIKHITDFFSGRIEND